MPPIAKFSRERIIEVTYEIVRNEGIDAINARRIAKELGSSVQPIFHYFTNMDELKKVVGERILDKYRKYLLSGKDKDNPYREMGISYIKFAKDYPEFFKIIFMQKTKFNPEEFLMSDAISDDIIKIGQSFTNLSYDEQKKFHIKVWIFTHGIACLVATNTIVIEDEKIDELLRETVKELLKGYNKERNN